jgi:hypothetical protein
MSGQRPTDCWSLLAIHVDRRPLEILIVEGPTNLLDVVRPVQLVQGDHAEASKRDIRCIEEDSCRC